MKQMVEIYIKLAELETKKEVSALFQKELGNFINIHHVDIIFHPTYCQDTNKRIPLPREVRSISQLELVR
jgi:hypothetical protein